MLTRTTIGLVLALLVALPATEQWLAAAKLRDYTTALREWRRFAEQGLARAQYRFGLMYFKGHGVPKDDAEAVKWYRKAANQGHAHGQYSLGLMYLKGLGVPKDDAEAVKWYRKAANQGHAHGQYSLGLMYLKGLGVTQNFILAYMWFGLSAASGLEYGPSGQDRAAWHMNPAQIAEAQKLARQWLDKHKKK